MKPDRGKNVPAAAADDAIGTRLHCLEMKKEGCNNSPLFFADHPRDGAAGPSPGSPVTVVFQNRAGLFSFDTVVRSAGGGVLRLDQVERLRRTQRRKYYRRRVRLGVQVLPREGQPPLASQLLDLGGDGASLVNPQRKLSAGDLPELSFRVGGESFRLTAEVLRLSRGGQVLHVRFHGLRDADRDRLLGILFRSLGEAAR